MRVLTILWNWWFGQECGDRVPAQFMVCKRVRGHYGKHQCLFVLGGYSWE